jgi:hypothetical protein
VEFFESSHIYECVPPVLGIPQNPDPVVVGLRVVTLPEIDAESHAARNLTPEAITARTRKLLASKVAFIKNLTVGGVEIKTFDELYEKGPPEISNWVMRAIYSTQLLSEAERKN